jgi:hypothetical protein
MGNIDEEFIFRIKASPMFWREKAKELQFASEILWPYFEKRFDIIYSHINDPLSLDVNSLDPDVFPIYLSLIGFSTEALFKGIIVRDNPQFVAHGKISREITIHDLNKLALIAKYQLSQEESIFCKQAYKAMIIESRYPVAKNKDEEIYENEIGGHCKEVFTNLFDKIYPTLNNVIKP